jgi:hypothetical protein
VGNDINIYQLNLGSFIILKFLVENPFNFFFLHLFNNDYIIIYISKEKPLPYGRGGYFIGGLGIIFLVFF